jgi:hypothetical protein
MATYRGKNFLACLANSCQFSPAANPTTRQSCPNPWTTSSVRRPIEPVDPNITILLPTAGLIPSIKNTGLFAENTYQPCC